ncbi:thiol-disulfide oxidoreductase ResA [Algivirga pacifica]|uniref:Thiol-disulfide oxidoreductase ResA n=2 Tax=Algivirga pacifica TaxID=1162670 RepID=A0ABP9DSC6_9BACT
MKLRMQSIRWFFPVVMTLLLGACGEQKAPKQGEMAPNFELTGLDGKPYSLKEQKGKLVLLNFWKDNCDVCKKEFPLMEEYYREFGGENFEILAVYLGDSKSAPQEFKDNYDITFPLLKEGKDVAFGQYKIRATPTNYLITPEGKVIRKVVGFVDAQQIKAILYNIKMNQ